MEKVVIELIELVLLTYLPIVTSYQSFLDLTAPNLSESGFLRELFSDHTHIFPSVGKLKVNRTLGMAK